MTLDVDGAPVKTALYRSYKAAEMAGKPIKITNTGDAPVQAVVSVSGAPITPEPAASNGFKIERNYFTLDGKPADVVEGQAERSLRGGAEDHRGQAGIRSHHGVGLSAGRS